MKFVIFWSEKIIILLFSNTNIFGDNAMQIKRLDPFCPSHSQKFIFEPSAPRVETKLLYFCQSIEKFPENKNGFTYWMEVITLSLLITDTKTNSASF